ncbi:MAG TPA: DNA-binding domain-containing protein [Opitutaceae bacterium]|nr:DNA-binding domain-containing protein [Opitutaceae bacterium]
MKEVVPVGLKAPPRRAPRPQRTAADLLALQRLMTRALVRPLAPGGRLQRRWIDGRRMREVAEQFIKPNDRLSAVERLEIYNRMYWYRLIGCVHDDCPGLRAYLGERRFDRLTQAYLARYPSRSFTLRNLCARLPQFIRQEPRWTAPRTAAARAIARFEWAQTVAFDGEAAPVLTQGDLSGRPPARLRVGLQPYASLLALDYAVDEFVVAAKQRNALRGEASNAVDSVRRGRAPRRRAPALRRERIYLVVHRYRGRLYHKRLGRPAFRILQALAAGRTVQQAVSAGGRRADPAQLQKDFATWMGLGWLCPRR